jgi:hypothetical protein
MKKRTVVVASTDGRASKSKSVNTPEAIGSPAVQKAFANYCSFESQLRIEAMKKAKDGVAISDPMFFLSLVNLNLSYLVNPFKDHSLQLSKQLMLNEYCEKSTIVEFDDLVESIGSFVASYKGNLTLKDFIDSLYSVLEHLSSSDFEVLGCHIALARLRSDICHTFRKRLSVLSLAYQSAIIGRCQVDQEMFDMLGGCSKGGNEDGSK